MTILTIALNDNWRVARSGDDSWTLQRRIGSRSSERGLAPEWVDIVTRKRREDFADANIIRHIFARCGMGDTVDVATLESIRRDVDYSYPSAEI